MLTMHGHTHSDDDDHHHGHKHHGHSHRMGAATRYWREPKPLAITVCAFILLLLFQALKGTPKVETSDVASTPLFAKGMPEDGQTVLWHDGSIPRHSEAANVFFRKFPSPMDTSCEFRNATLRTISPKELAMVRFTYCGSLECYWAMTEMLGNSAVHLVDGELRSRFKDIPGFDGTMARVVSETELSNFLRAKHNAVPFVRENKPCKPYPLSTTRSIVLQDCKTAGNRQCDNQCPEQQPGWFYRSDIMACVYASPCNVLSMSACLDDDLKAKCKLDCDSFFRQEMRQESTRNSTVAIALLTLFGLGFVLGLLFAKLYWVDPLLDANEVLEARLNSNA